MAVAELIPAVVGALSCQRDSYLQSLESEVVSCIEYVPSQAKTNDKATGKKSIQSEQPTRAGTATSPNSWLIEFADSVLFPEGTCCQ
jgi:misacylated tRNA(Ala) deacylase